VIVRPCTRADLPAAAALLGRAFQAEPVYEWLLPDPARRRTRLPVLLRGTLPRLHRRPGSFELAAVDGHVVGAAVWDPPGPRHAGPLTRAVVWAARVRTLGPRLGRLAELSAKFDAGRPAEPHWYLDHLGADPDVPRCGAGSALLASGLARADADRVGSYLECKAENVGYYQRVGFGLRSEFAIAPGMPTVLTMWRPPPP